VLVIVVLFNFLSNGYAVPEGDRVQITTAKPIKAQPIISSRRVAEVLKPFLSMLSPVCMFLVVVFH
jgi:hypothetical protein